MSRVPHRCPHDFKGRYTVVSGDTMFFIAKRFEISLDSLIAANRHIADPNLIYPGDVLCVPREEGGRVPAHCPYGFKGRYTVVSGDTMFFIAKRFEISLDSLIDANRHIADPNLIYPGDVLCVPKEEGGRVPAHCPHGFKDRYTVQPGDTMSSVAKKFKVGLDDLIAANPQITDPDYIFPGDVLCVPGKKEKGRIPASCPSGFQGRYIVQYGESIFSIAQMFGIEADVLIAANPHISDPSVLFPGDELCVPSRVPASCPSGFQGRYTVQPGDTFSSIAKMLKISLDALVDANPQIADPNMIFPGDELCVPF